MRNLLTLLVFALHVFMFAGCYDNHGRFVPVMPTGDAGPMTSDSARPLSGGVTVTCTPPSARAELLTGETGVVFDMSVTPGDRPVFIDRADFDFGWNGRSLGGRIFGHESGRPYFTEWYLTADDPLRIFNPAPGAIVPSGEERRGSVSLDTSLWTEGPFTSETRVRLTTSIAPTEEGVHTLTYGYYTSRLTDIDFTYADTGLPVPASEMTLRGCDDPDAFEFFVRANFPDMIADLSDSVGSSVTRGEVGGHPSLGIFVLNDGAREGVLQHFVLEAHVTHVLADGREVPSTSRNFMRSCALYQEGVFLSWGARRPDGDTFDFEGLDIRVPGRTDVEEIIVEVGCEYNNSMLGAGESAIFAFSAPYDQFRPARVSAEDPSRISGTLMLAQNHLHSPDERVSVTLLP